MNARAIKDLNKILTNPFPGIVVKLTDEDRKILDISMAGPVGSPYEGGIFRITLGLPDNYPFLPPEILFITKIYHPCVSINGKIGLNALNKFYWNPVQSIATVLTAIQNMLSNPDDTADPENPRGISVLNEFVCNHWQGNRLDAIEVAKAWTERYAK